MKKLIGVSLIAILTVGAAHAAPEYADAVPVEPISITANTHVASTSYVQGAYNEAIKAVNKENQRALAAEGNLETLTTTAKTSLVGAINSLKTEISNIDTGVQSVTEGTTNGTIKVDDTDVAVHGLGSAAYEAATAFDAAGTAATAEQNAKDYADGLAANYATAAQGEKADQAAIDIGSMDGLTGTATTLVGAIEEVRTAADGALVKADITEGATNGTIAVEGTDVTVHGLGSAAFTETSAYATAAQGTTAEAVNTLVGNTAMGTTATTVTGAIKELKDASDATNNKVLKVYTTWNTDANQEVTLTAPTVQP